ncbi:MAG: OmpA family protein [Saprospiraceae bacterium]|nr:OmpA family protein [Saprospiraceae bacterium]MDW8484439.1 OmpA family protein [Saprospiraceae bacterium]
MNKSLVAPIIVFVIWSAICWRWYVCGIKRACDGRATPLSPVAGKATLFPVDTFLQQNTNTVTLDTLSPLEPATQLPSPPKSSGEDIEQVSFSELTDQILIHFPYNSIRKEDNAAVDAYLSRLADYLVSSGRKIFITGHTDNVGDPKSNYRLGLQRAQAIRRILVTKGVPAEQIHCLSKGEKEPIATNDNPRGRYKNRRVEIRINP